MCCVPTVWRAIDLRSQRISKTHCVTQSKQCKIGPLRSNESIRGEWICLEAGSMVHVHVCAHVGIQTLEAWPSDLLHLPRPCSHIISKNRLAAAVNRWQCSNGSQVRVTVKSAHWQILFSRAHSYIPSAWHNVNKHFSLLLYRVHMKINWKLPRLFAPSPCVPDTFSAMHIHDIYWYVLSGCGATLLSFN